jgi:hypothetical protein
MIKRRGELAGVEVHPHTFRHTFAHKWLDSGGNEHDLMRLTGGRTPSWSLGTRPPRLLSEPLGLTSGWRLGTISEPFPGPD